MDGHTRSAGRASGQTERNDREKNILIDVVDVVDSRTLFRRRVATATAIALGHGEMYRLRRSAITCSFALLNIFHVSPYLFSDAV